MGRFKSIFCFSLLILAAVSSVQAGSVNSWHHGFIVTQHNDTIRGKLQIESLNKDSTYALQQHLTFDNGKNTIGYTPADLVSFTYFEGSKEKGKQTSFDKTKNPERDGWVFAKRYVRGPCNVFGYTSTRMDIAPGNVALYSLHEIKYLQIGDLTVAVHEEDFEEYLKQLFAKCPLILSKLDKKKYEPRDWMKMVKDYNAGLCK